MCLDELRSMDELPKINIGYKVMYQSRSNEYMYMPVHMHHPTFEVGVEVTDTCETIVCAQSGLVKLGIIDNESYKTGFHIFLGLDEAIGYMTSDCDKLFLVHFSDVTAWGFQQNTTDITVVARRMTLIREVTPEEIDKHYAIMTAKHEPDPLPQQDTPIECDQCKKVINLSEARVDLTGNHFCDGKCEYEYWHTLGRCE